MITRKMVKVVSICLFVLLISCIVSAQASRTFTRSYTITSEAWPVEGFIDTDMKCPHSYHILNVGTTNIYISTDPFGYWGIQPGLDYIWFCIQPKKDVTIKNLNQVLWVVTKPNKTGKINMIEQWD